MYYSSWKYASERSRFEKKLIRFMEKPYQMDHSLTRTQKEILNAFGIDSAYVRKAAAKISSVLDAENGGKE